MIRRLFVLGCLAAVVHAAEPPPHAVPKPEDPAKSYPLRADSPDSATLIDWAFLDKANVIVSDGKKNATIGFPPELKTLDNHRVAIVGFMAPWEQIDDMTKFILVPSYVGCYFCAPPAVTQVALVEQANPKKKKLPFINEAVIVTGTLRLFTYASKHPAHQADFLYALDDAVAEVYTGRNKPTRIPAHLPPDPKRQPKVY